MHPVCSVQTLLGLSGFGCADSTCFQPRHSVLPDVQAEGMHCFGMETGVIRETQVAVVVVLVVVVLCSTGMFDIFQ